MKKTLLFVPLISLLFLFQFDIILAHPAKDMYNQSVDLIDQGKLLDAQEKFQQLHLMYPFSSSAMKAQLMSTFINYVRGHYMTAALDADRYIMMYKYSDDIEYIYYLRAMSYYNQIDIVERDTNMAKYALSAFDEIIQQFSDSEYVEEAKIKYADLLNYFAAKEMKIGLFYFRHGNYIAGIKRLEAIISNYQETDYIQEAVYKLSEVFHILGLPEDSKYYADKLDQPRY